MLKKLAIISTHPIQYYAPIFQLLAKEIELKVFYTRGESETSNFDNGFKKQIEWDVPLLAGYNYTFVENVAKDPGTHHFNGIINPTLIAEIEEFTPDAILIYGWALNSHLKAIRYFKNKILIYFRGDSTLINQRKGIKNLFKTIFLRFVYSHIDFAFYVGQQNKAYFKKYGLKENQLIFAPHAIDNERFAENRATEANALRKTLKIDPEEILILFAGKFDVVKKTMLLLDAFIEMGKRLEVGSWKSEERGGNENKSFHKVTPSEQYAQDDDLIKNESEDGSQNSKYTFVKEGQPRETKNEKRKTKNEKQKTNKIHLLFVGNGELEESLKLKVESLKESESKVGSSMSEERVFNEGTSFHFAQDEINYNGDPNLKSKISNLKSKNIHFIDFQNQTQMPVIYQACDLFSLPSCSETWGLAVNEAMACGKAVLVSDRVGCAVDLVQNNINGAIFESGSLDDLIDKLKILCKSKNQLVSFGQQSKKIIQIWSFQHQVDAIINTICKK